MRYKGGNIPLYAEQSNSVAIKTHMKTKMKMQERRNLQIRYLKKCCKEMPVPTWQQGRPWNQQGSWKRPWGWSPFNCVKEAFYMFQIHFKYIPWGCLPFRCFKYISWSEIKDEKSPLLLSTRPPSQLIKESGRSKLPPLILSLPQDPRQSELNWNPLSVLQNLAQEKSSSPLSTKLRKSSSLPD